MPESLDRVIVDGQTDRGASQGAASATRRIRSDLEALEREPSLYEEMHFSDRAEALDFLEFDVFERVESLLRAGFDRGKLLSLKQYAERVRERLDDVNETVFRRLRERIASGHCSSAELRDAIVGYMGGSTGRKNAGDEGYDELDMFIGGLLLTEAAPERISDRQPGMVFYQPTPARIVMELVGKAGFRQEDVFYDIGSGLGQVAILVHLLSGVRVVGVESEPAYCEYARQCARSLSLSRVVFINADAREANYSDGTVFYLYTPCEGEMLDHVVGRLETESRGRRIRLFTYGPCTVKVAQQPWLDRLDQGGEQVYRLAVFQTSGTRAQPVCQ